LSLTRECSPTGLLGSYRNYQPAMSELVTPPLTREGCTGTIGKEANPDLTNARKRGQMLAGGEHDGRKYEPSRSSKQLVEEQISSRLSSAG
jgi:hypothetical protein